MKDLRLSLRHLTKSPGFSLTIILTLALGIGANTAIFTLIHAVMMKSLPVGDPNSLVRIGDTDSCCVNGGIPNRNGDFDIFSYDLYRHFQQTSPEFEQLAAMQSGSSTVVVRRGSEPAQSGRSEYVSGNYFLTFGVGPFAGRMLTQNDDIQGADPAVVMSYAAWQSKFAGDPSVVGSTVFIQSHPVTIAGVAPPGFFGDRLAPNPPDFWIPLSLEPVIEREGSILRVPDSNWLYVVGRLKPGVNIGLLQARISNDLRSWLSSEDAFIRQNIADVIAKQYVRITPAGGGIQSMQQNTSKQLYLLMTISALVLLVACANVANLLLARATTRRAETSIRMALGAGRARLIRQLLTESVLLGCIGGFAGLSVAYFGTKTILALTFPQATGLPIDATPSTPVLAFAFGISFVTGILFGTVPAWITSHADPAEALRGINRSTRDRASMPQKSLIIFQAAMSMVLLTGAGLLTRSLQNMQHQYLGIQTTNRYVFHIDPAGAGYTSEKLSALNERLEQQFKQLPGMQNVGLALYSTLEGNNWGESVYIQGRPNPASNEDTGSSWDRVSPGFFQTVGQPIIRGRGFTDADTATSQKVAVVNQRFVKKFFPNEDPIGRHFGIFEPKFSSTFEIVGVVADAKYSSPREEVFPMYFRPLTQRLETLTESGAKTAEDRSLYINSITLYFGSPQQNIDATVRRALAQVDPNLTILDLLPLEGQVNGNFNQERMVARLTTMFGVLALIVSSFGLYGITSYTVAKRTNEIGLRIAVGADRIHIVRMVLRGVFSQVVIGLLIGIPVVLLSGRFMADQLYAVKIFDPICLGGAISALLFAATLAAIIPARRAASIEPMQALRSE
jgi:predicted permease